MWMRQGGGTTTLTSPLLPGFALPVADVFELLTSPHTARVTMKA
ncbi:MAG: hypothetical protein WKF99_00065 [Solirubrobacteraceae bacterium]